MAQLRDLCNAKVGLKRPPALVSPPTWFSRHPFSAVTEDDQKHGLVFLGKCLRLFEWEPSDAGNEL
jgi:hypothetical protein